MDADHLRENASVIAHDAGAILGGGLPTDVLLIARNDVRAIACLLDGEARHRDDRALRGLARQAWAVSSQLGWVARQSDEPLGGGPARETVDDLRVAAARSRELAGGLRVHADLWDAEALRPLPVAGREASRTDPVRAQRLRLVAGVLDHAAGYTRGDPARLDERVSIVTDQVERALELLWRDGEISRDPAVRSLRTGMVRTASMLTAGADLYRDLLTAPEHHGRAAGLLRRAGDEARSLAADVRSRADSLAPDTPPAPPTAGPPTPAVRVHPLRPALPQLGGPAL